MPHIEVDDGINFSVFDALFRIDLRDDAESDALGVLRRLLRTLGHDAHGWGQGRNVGPRGDTLQQALQRIEDLHRSSGRKLSLVGWSLGGLYARELAKQAPHAVRAVVTLGSPFAGPMQANNAWRTYQWVRRHRPPHAGPRPELRPAPPVPTTSIYSRSDGVVAWPCSLQVAGPMSESIEVAASHLGLGVNPKLLAHLKQRGFLGADDAG